VRPDKVRFPPPGFLGGRPGLAGAFSLNGAQVSIEPHTLRPGDELRLRLPGGGGYGDPRERPVADVIRDVVDGYVSLGVARREYGIAVDPETGTGRRVDRAGAGARRPAGAPAARRQRGKTRRPQRAAPTRARRRLAGR
ncbi:MAG TPA: hydantoinase B/oxoprolinase family protein, partial [bacterium]|nr:hydantoinase B/oxoprolinase family protein [bacterium]